MAMTFKEYMEKRDLQEAMKAIKYKPGAVIPTSIRSGGPEKMNPLGVVNPFKPKPYAPIFRKA